MDNYINTLYKEHKINIDILKEKFNILTEELFKSCNNQDTTGLNDCLFLSLLVNHYKPSIIIEIGTWVGTTSLTMASSYDKAHVYTCDTSNKFVKQDLPQYNRIHIHPNTHSTQLLKKLNNLRNVKMFFNDAVITEEDCELMISMSSDSFIFVTHDYYNSTGGFEKGHDAIEKFKSECDKKNIIYTEYVPLKDWYFEDRINGCCAILLCKMN